MSGTVLDPVCGMTIDPAHASGEVDYRGTTYYFCNPICRARFEADPERYLDPPHASPAAMPGDPQAEYTGPMHPEVRQRGPGACPKCGMALEPVDVTEDVENPELDDMSRRFWWSAALTVPIIRWMAGELRPGGRGHSLMASPVLRWTEFALATPVVVWGGWPFFKRGWASIV